MKEKELKKIITKDSDKSFLRELSSDDMRQLQGGFKKCDCVVAFCPDCDVDSED